MSNPTALVQKLWNYCNILRDDGLSYGDYVEQLTFLLFLKMADEQSRPPFNKPSAVPKDYAWPSPLARVERLERGGGVGVGGVGQPPARHPPPPVHFATRLHRQFVKRVYTSNPKWHIGARQETINREANRETD